MARQAHRALEKSGALGVSGGGWNQRIADPDRARSAFAQLGHDLPDGPLTMRDLFIAATGDVDGNGRVDVDLGALAAAGFVKASSHDGTRIDDALRYDQVFGKNFKEAFDLRADRTTLRVGWLQRRNEFVSVASGPLAGVQLAGMRPDRFDLELGENGRGEITVYEGDKHRTLRFTLRPELRVFGPGRGREAARELIGSVLRKAAEEAPRGSPLARVQAGLEADHALSTASQAPANPALASVWNAKRATRESRVAIAKDIERELGLPPRNYLPWVQHASDARLLEIVNEKAAAVDLEPGLLFVTLGAEGLLHAQFGFGKQHARTIEGLDLGAEVDGYSALGTDTFGTRIESLKAAGHLRSDFRAGVDYHPSKTKNEHHRTVHPGVFVDTERGIEAVAAMLASARDEFLADATELYGADAVSSLSADQLAYFTSLYYNAGAKTGQLVLKRGLDLEKHRHRGPAPDTNTRARPNALRRLATLQSLGRLGVFER